MNQRALVAGASGVTGSYLAEHLVSLGWEVFGLARTPRTDLQGVEPIAADLLQPGPLAEALDGVDPTHVFFTTWLRQPTEEENCRVNGALVDNLLTAVTNGGNVQHVGLVTGGKTYFGSFTDIGKYDVTTPYREEQPRKLGLNFYYTQEDILFEHAAREGFSWNVHRPCSGIVGYAPGNAMNIATTFAVYATICKEAGRPFVFPGSPTQYGGIAELVDAGIIARQIAWAATTAEAHDYAFNVSNGDLFRWNWMWEQIAGYFELEVAPYPGHPTSLEAAMSDANTLWQDVVEKYGLIQYTADQLAPWWHADIDLTRPFESFPDLSRCRMLGFLDFKKSTTSLFDVFDRLRSEKVIPS